MIFNVFIYDSFCGYSEPLKIEATTPTEARTKAKNYIKLWNIQGYIEKITK